MKNRNLDHKDNWGTPLDFYYKLDNEFHFNFDPCPLNHDLELWDGLKIEWGDIYYINISKWNILNAQSVENLNQQNVLVNAPNENEDILLNAINVEPEILIKELNLKENNDIFHLKSTNFYPIICQDALDVILSNHLMKLIFLKTRKIEQDLVPIVKYAKENFLKLICNEEELIQLSKSLLNNKNINIDIQKKDEKHIEKVLLSEIKNIEQKYLNGLLPIGIDVNYFLEINVPIVDVKNFLIKTILSQYLTMIVQEQYQKTLSPHVQNVIHQKEQNPLMNGVLMNQLNELKNTSNIWMKLNNHSKVFINPPYSDKKESGYLKTSFVKKAVEESRKGKLCVMLLPNSTGTKLFHNVILPEKPEIRFVKGRLRFEGINTFGDKVTDKTGMHDSLIIIFNGKNTYKPF